jgi:hypothetical protein
VKIWFKWRLTGGKIKPIIRSFVGVFRASKRLITNFWIIICYTQLSPAVNPRSWMVINHESLSSSGGNTSNYWYDAGLGIINPSYQSKKSEDLHNPHSFLCGKSQNTAPLAAVFFIEPD